MQIKEFLYSVCEQIKYKPIRESIAEELKNHIEESKENYRQEGLEEQIAEEKAIKQMGKAQEIGKKLNKIHRPKLDWKLLLILMILLCFSVILVLIMSRNDIELFGAEGESIKKFVTFVIIGIVVSIPIYFINYTKIKKYSNLLYLLATLSIIWALLFGSFVNGKPYIYLHLMTIAPEIVAIPLYIVAFIGFISKSKRENKIETSILKYTKIRINMDLVKIIGLSILSLVFLELIPSITSVWTLGLIYMILGTAKILQVKENKIKNMVKLWGSVILIGIFILMQILTSNPYILNRLIASINPRNDATGDGWIAVERKSIIESAKLWGEAENTSNAIDLFDEGTNFAFISVLAHYGWIVSIGIVLAIITFSIKLILNAIKIKDNYGKLLIIGLSSMFILQSIFNILMNLNLWIEAGFYLPFISYGGGSLVINMMSLTFILAIYRKKDIIMIQNKTLVNQ